MYHMQCRVARNVKKTAGSKMDVHVRKLTGTVFFSSMPGPLQLHIGLPNNMPSCTLC